MAKFLNSSGTTYHLEELIKNDVITSEEYKVLENHIIFMDKTLSYERINDLFNAADLYISPLFALLVSELGTIQMPEKLIES